MPKHEAMDTGTVADLLGVSDRQVRTWMTQGMPYTKDGRTPVFDWPAARDWWAAYKFGGLATLPAEPEFDEDNPEDIETAPLRAGKPENLQQANLRKTVAEADTKQLALARARGEVIDIAAARERLGRMLGNQRTKLLGLPPKLANRLEGLKDRAAREAVIAEEMTTLCSELSTGEVVGGPPPEPDADAPQPEVLDSVAASAAESPGADIALGWVGEL